MMEKIEKKGLKSLLISGHKIIIDVFCKKNVFAYKIFYDFFKNLLSSYNVDLTFFHVF